MRHRGKYHGVLNGIDTVLWDPERDPHLPATFSGESFFGKSLTNLGMRLLPCVYWSAVWCISSGLVRVDSRTSAGSILWADMTSAEPLRCTNQFIGTFAQAFVKEP